MVKDKPEYTPQSKCKELKKKKNPDDPEEEEKKVEEPPKKEKQKQHLSGKACRALLLRKPKQVGCVLIVDPARIFNNPDLCHSFCQ